MARKKAEWNEGSGKIGDRVLVVTHRNAGAIITEQTTPDTFRCLQMKILVGTIVRVGLINSSGHALDYEVQYVKNRQKQQICGSWNKFMPGDRRPTKIVPVGLVLVPESEQPLEVRLWVASQKGIVLEWPQRQKDLLPSITSVTSSPASLV